MSKLTLLGFGILAWGGAMALVALSYSGTLGQALAAVGGLGATAGLVLSIIGAARHGEL